MNRLLPNILCTKPSFTHAPYLASLMSRVIDDRSPDKIKHLPSNAQEPSTDDRSVHTVSGVSI